MATECKHLVIDTDGGVDDIAVWYKFTLHRLSQLTQALFSCSTFFRFFKSNFPFFFFSFSFGIKAILVALKGCSLGHCRLLAITTVFGNTNAQQAAENVAQVLQSFAEEFPSQNDFSSASVPVFVGSKNSILTTKTLPSWPGVFFFEQFFFANIFLIKHSFCVCFFFFCFSTEKMAWVVQSLITHGIQTDYLMKNRYKYIYALFF